MADEGTNGAAMAHPQVQFGGVIGQKNPMACVTPLHQALKEFLRDL